MSDVTSAWPAMSGFGEALLFWVTAALMVAGALGVLLFKKAAYAVLSMVVVMVGMAVLFFALQAPFNGSVQIVVYTGAILMLFLFVIMMIGLGASDGYQRQRRGYIVTGCLLGAALSVLLVGAVFMSRVSGPGQFAVDPYSNEPVTLLAQTLFQDHWMTIELTAALLITAAIGALLLAHSDRLGPKLSQKRVARARLEAFARSGQPLGQLPPPGVYATSNSVDNPAIAGDTLTLAKESVPRVLRVRGLEKPLNEVEPQLVDELREARDGSRKETNWDNSGVKQSQAWGMRGARAPQGLKQMQAKDAEGDK